jgi:hypothetical protein
MSQLLSAPDPADAQAAPLTFASLQCEVFARAPVHARARAACVCHAWCDVLSERSLWLHLDLSPSGGVARTRVTDALLHGAAAKARGGLTALDVSECEQLTHEALLEVVTANAGALIELRQQFLKRMVLAEHLTALLFAAPLLTVCHANAQADAAAACRMLRNELPFGPLHLHSLSVEQPWLGGEAHVCAFAADMTASASSLAHLMLADAPLGGLRALDAVVDAALARRLPTLMLFESSLSAASVPALARLLSGSALITLFLMFNDDVTLLQSGPEGSAALLAAALRVNSTLTTLGLMQINVWHDAAAAETLLQALTAHPSVQTVNLGFNGVAVADRARAGASLGALVEANVPALKELFVSGCGLGDEGIGPLVDALAVNTHMRKLVCSGNDMSDAFALERLQPALLANNSLRRLMLVADDVANAASPALRQLEQLVTERAAARDDAVAAMTAATAAVAVQ